MLSEEQILTLAPDESSRKAGKDLANGSKWVTRGATEGALWGECQGSGSKPYQTGIDLTSIAFKCSCPSRKFPCKHGIALGLLYSRQPATFTGTEVPGWLTEWLAKRSEKEEKKEEKKEKPVDEAAQAKRQQAREEKVSDGIEELLVWIKDIIRQGLLSLPDKGYPFWEGMARRMVDAQAPGLAGLVRSLGNTPFFTEGWQSTFMDNLLNLYLVARGFQNRAGLDEALLHDVHSSIGFTVSQDELRGGKGVGDTWLVVSKQVTEEDNLTVERNWLYGLTTRRFALVLQFLARGASAQHLLSPGIYLDAELVFYPGASSVRALVKNSAGATSRPPLPLLASWENVAEEESRITEKFPLRYERPYAVRQLVPVPFNGGWWLCDEGGKMVSLKEGYTGLWKLLALSGGLPLDLVVIGKEGTYEPVGVWQNQTYKMI